MGTGSILLYPNAILPPAPLEEVIHVLVFSIPPPSPSVLISFFPVDLSVQSTTSLSRADLGPLLCKTDLSVRAGSVTVVWLSAFCPKRADATSNLSAWIFMS